MNCYNDKDLNIKEHLVSFFCSDNFNPIILDAFYMFSCSDFVIEDRGTILGIKRFINEKLLMYVNKNGDIRYPLISTTLMSNEIELYNCQDLYKKTMDVYNDNPDSVKIKEKVSKPKTKSKEDINKSRIKSAKMYYSNISKVIAKYIENSNRTISKDDI